MFIVFIEKKKTIFRVIQATYLNVLLCSRLLFGICYDENGSFKFR